MLTTGAGAGVYMGNNVYRDCRNSRWEYINTDEASQYCQANGEHVWRYAASGFCERSDHMVAGHENRQLRAVGSLGRQLRVLLMQMI